MQPNEGFFKKVYPILIVTIVVFASVIFLNFANAFSAPLIQAQEDAAFLAPLKAIFPDYTDFKKEGDVFTLSGGGKTVGYAFKAKGTGYGGDIIIVVAIAPDKSTVKGISVISQSETAGLGTRVTLPSFTDRFAGKKIEEVKLRADGGTIDGISGSTISSRAVVNAVRETALSIIGTLP